MPTRELNPFDPPDPQTNRAVHDVTGPENHLDPEERIRRGFQQLRIEDRTSPGYPGAAIFSDSAFSWPGSLFNPPTSYSPPLHTAYFSGADNRQPMIQDQFDPLSQKLGVRDVALPLEKALLTPPSPNWGEPDLPIRKKVTKR